MGGERPEAGLCRFISAYELQYDELGKQLQGERYDLGNLYGAVSKKHLTLAVKAFVSQTENACIPKLPVKTNYRCVRSARQILIKHQGGNEITTIDSIVEVNGHKILADISVSNPEGVRKHYFNNKKRFPTGVFEELFGPDYRRILAVCQDLDTPSRKGVQVIKLPFSILGFHAAAQKIGHEYDLIRKSSYSSSIKNWPV